LHWQCFLLFQQVQVIRENKHTCRSEANHTTQGEITPEEASGGRKLYVQTRGEGGPCREHRQNQI
jgi:hypothetical protein